MSKESRRAARLARESRRAAGAGRPPAETGAKSATGVPAGTQASGAHAGAAHGTRKPSSGPGGPRAGRRERARPYHQPTFLERYRTWIVGIAAVAIAAVAIGWVFIGATSAAYTCTNTFNPSTTPPVEPGSSTRLGFQQEDMGNSHIVSTPQNYLYCPPASGNHFNASGLGPIQPRVYKPTDKVGPPNWIHNLEHGGLVVLYKTDSDGATNAGQQAFKQFFDTFPTSPLCGIPAGQLSPVIAPFNDMPHPYAALVWGRVMYLDTWDPALVDRFYLTESERLDANGDLVAPPEDVTGCGARLKSSANPSLEPSAEAASPSAPAASAPASAAPLVAPSAEASPAPS